MLRRTVITTTLLLAGCASGPGRPPASEPAAAALPSAGPTAAELPLEIRWVRDSAEYRAALAQTYRLARAVLERRVEGRQPGSWAVAVDADETLISNVEQSVEAVGTEGSFEEQWDAWVERREAPALPGARAFLERVRELGGRIAVVTNRRQRHCPQTADNLRAQGLPFDVLLCRREEGDKGPRWRSVEEGTASPELPPLEIVMWLGDNIHDFPGLDQRLADAGPEALAEFGERYFVFPNPLYGSWEHHAPD